MKKHSALWRVGSRFSSDTQLFCHKSDRPPSSECVLVLQSTRYFTIAICSCCHSVTVVKLYWWCTARPGTFA